MGTLRHYIDPNDYLDAYSPEEIELNSKLYKECIKTDPDFDYIERLLTKGADPLGPYSADSHWDLLGHGLSDLIWESCDTRKNLPELTRLFLHCGMDIDHPRIPYDNENSLSPLWHLGYCENEEVVEIMSILLDSSISIASIDVFLHHFCEFYEDENPNEVVPVEYIVFLKTLMLIASYDYVYQTVHDYKDFIRAEENDYDVHKFRRFDGFKYIIDNPKLFGSTVRIVELKSGRTVWKIRNFGMK